MTELAKIQGCTLDDLPPTVSKETARRFLKLSNPKTLNDWISGKTHGIEYVKVGRSVEPTTEWLVDMKMRGLNLQQTTN